MKLLIFSILGGIVATLIVGFVWYLLSKINHYVKNSIAILFVIFLNVLYVYLLKTIDAAVFEYYCLYAVFPFCGSFLLTALVYDWVEVVQKRKKDKQLIWASIVIVCFVLAAYITHRIGWCSIAEITKTFILIPFTVSFIVYLIYSAYAKKNRNK
ncbi:MAG: hypothetical protein GX292_02495 [Bacteroidales bacterium]|jgi:hypothetical protein|nr:hypothetical protein [Bacteroidales bacterium]